MAKHFEQTITDVSFDFARKSEAIAEEARFDGFYVLRTSLSAERIDTAGTVRPTKAWPRWSARFGCMKTLDLELCPVFHWTAPRVRACAVVHAGVLPGVAHAPVVGADAVRRP